MPTATTTGPVTGGIRGRPFNAATLDLESFGYVEEEYFLEGTAAATELAVGAELREDGRWDVVIAGAAPYRTRLLVRRPADAAECNGTVYVEWLNVSGGFDVDTAFVHNHAELLRSGYVWVGASVQRAGVHGPPLVAGLSQPLTMWDEERYGTLEVPDDAHSYDIFTQVGRAVGRHRETSPVDLLGGLDIERVFAAGQSQSAARLASYVNAVQRSASVFDGFFIAARSGWAAPLGSGMVTRRAVRIRDDVDALVFRVNTESEALGSFPVRQPDGEHGRYWEVAGTAHQGSYVTAGLDPQFARDLDRPMPAGALPDNDMPVQHAMDAALWHLDRWARGVAEPPSLPLIDVAGNPPVIARDTFGNAKGGIRLPELEVPTKQYGPQGVPHVSHSLRGFAFPFDDAMLRALYPSHDAYVAKFTAATDAAVDAGYLLDADAEASLRAARAADVPPVRSRS